MRTKPTIKSVMEQYNVCRAFAKNMIFLYYGQQFSNQNQAKFKTFDAFIKSELAIKYTHEEMNKLLEAGYGDSAEFLNGIWNMHPDWTIEDVIKYSKSGIVSKDVISILESCL